MIKINYCSDTVAPSKKLLVPIQFANLEYDDTIEIQANSTPSPNNSPSRHTLAMKWNFDNII